MAEQAVPPKKDQKPRHRSPNYPAIGLKAAVGKIEALYKADGWAASPKLAALKHMGYDKLHSEAARTLSALKSFGLIEETVDRVKLTQRAIEIVARPHGDVRREKALKDSAVSPEIYQQVMEEYRLSGLPSDSSLKSDLITVRKFNPSAVDGFVRDFRETIDLAGLSDYRSVDQQSIKEEASNHPPSPQIGDFVQWESDGQIQFQEPRRLRALTEDGLWGFVDGSDTGLPIEEIKVVSSGASEKTNEHPVTVEAMQPVSIRPTKVGEALPYSKAPKVRSYAWALSGEFSAKMDLFGDANSEEDIDALADYVEITIKALKRSLKARASG